MKSNRPLIEARSLTRVYGTGQASVTALDGVSFELAEGEFVSIMGPSGSGKSTLLHVLGCLDVPNSGRLFLDGEELSCLDDRRLSLLRGRKLGFVFQSFNLLPQLDVRANIALPLVYGRQADPGGMERVDRLIGLLGLADRCGHRPTELSGGQSQRVAIARALVNKPRLLLADEPTGNLDSATGCAVMDLFLALNRAGLTIVMVTHNGELARYSSRIIRMRDGAVEADESVIDRRGPEVDDPRLAAMETYWRSLEGTS